MGSDAETLFCAASFTEVGEGDPLVLGVPDDGRDGEQEERGQHPEKITALQESAALGSERQVGNHGEDGGGVGPFAEKSQSGEYSGCDPPSRGCGCGGVGVAERSVGLMGCVKEREHGGYPEKDGERIDGHEDAAHVEDGKEIESDDSPDGWA